MLQENLIPNWEVYESIFNKGYKNIKERDVIKLNKIGCKVVYGGKHFKLYLPSGVLITISGTTPDTNRGRVTLREIRRHYFEHKVYNC